MIYLDTSVLVAVMTGEADGAAVQSWLDRRAEHDFCISRWVVTEFQSALSLKQRAKLLSDLQRNDVSDEFDIVLRSLTMYEIDNRHFDAATELVARPELGLRAGDALHLAIALDTLSDFATLDKVQGKAAFTMGLSVVDPR